MLSKLFRMANLEDPSVPLTGKNIAEAMTDQRRASSGELVGTAQACSYSPVWSALDQISSDIARLPWLPYRDAPAGRELLRKHPIYPLMTGTVDGGQTTANIWLVRMLCHALLYGNAYSRIHFVSVGGTRYVSRLEWVHSDKVIVQREDGATWYEITWNQFEDGAHKQQWERVEYDQMFHLQGLTLTHFGGLSLIHYARDTIGRQLATNKYGDEFFANSAVPQGFFSHPGNLSEPAQQRFIDQMERRFAGSGNRHKLGFLEEDMKWVTTGISPRDAMLVDAMKWGIPDVARFFSMPPHKLGDPSRQGWNTTEQENRSYYGSTLGKWTHRIVWESQKFWDPKERDEHYTAFDTDELLRADTAARYASYGVGIQWGFLTRNDVRKKENLPPLEGLDEPLTPVNMAAGPVPPAADPGKVAGLGEPDDEEDDEDETEENENDDAAERLRFAQRDVVADQLARMTKRVTRAAGKAAREPRGFLGWINGLEAEHGPAVREALTPAAGLVGALRREAADETLERLTAEFIGRSRDELLAAADVQAGQLVGSVDAAGDRLLAWCRDAATAWTSRGHN